MVCGRGVLAAYHGGEISYAELDASIQGWIAHVAHADSWGLRAHVLDTLVMRPAEHRRAKAARESQDEADVSDERKRPKNFERRR